MTGVTTTPADSAGDAELLRTTMHADRIDDDLVATARSSTSMEVLVALAVRTGDAGHLDEARRQAASARDRRLVVLAERHLAGDHEQFDALVRDHLVEHPDHVLAAWIAHHHRHQTEANRSTSC